MILIHAIMRGPFITPVIVPGQTSYLEFLVCVSQKKAETEFQNTISN